MLCLISTNVLKNDKLEKENKKLQKVKSTKTKNKKQKPKKERKLSSKISKRKKKSKTPKKSSKPSKTKIVYADEKSETDRNLSSGAESTCILSARVYPLIFYGQTQSLEFKLVFSSDCLERQILQYFLVPPTVKTSLSFLDHPSFVNLVLFGKQFKFKFTVPYQRGNGFGKNIAYQFFQLYPATISDAINSFDEHLVKVSSLSEENYFTLNEIKSLSSVLNPYPCEIIQSNKIMNCVVEA